MIDKFVVGETYVSQEGVEDTVSSIQGDLVFVHREGWGYPGYAIAVLGYPSYLRAFTLVDNKSNVCEDWS